MANTVEQPAVAPVPLGAGPAANRVVIKIWLAIVAAGAIGWWFGIRPNGDGDDLLKYAKIRAFLDSGAWFERTVPGILQPEPFHSHWPRLLDLPYALFAWLLTPAAGRDAALQAAAFAVPLLFLLAALLLYRRIIAALGFARPDAAFLLALLPAAHSLFEFWPMRIDYHNVEILALLAVIVLTFARTAAASAASGAIVGLTLAMSTEFALYFATLMGVMLFEFARGDDGARARLGWFGAALGLAALAAYGLTVPPGSYGAVACDSYSPPQLLALLLGSACFAGGASLGGAVRRPLPRAALVAAPAAAGLAALALSFPHCLAGPYADLGDYLREAWLLNIGQERSLFARPDFLSDANIAAFAVLFVGGLAPAAVALAHRPRDRALVIFALLSLVALAQTVMLFRYSRYMPLFAAPGLLMVLAAVVPGLRAEGALLAGRFSVARSPLVMLAPGLAALVLVCGVNWVRARPPEVEPAANFAGECDIYAIGRFDWPAGARVMAPPLVGIYLLPSIGEAAVVDVPFHTGRFGLERAYRFFDAAPDAARPVLDESRATHVAICGWRGETPASLLARYPFTGGLVVGKAPDWLTECPTGASSPIRIYRYAAAGGASCPVER